VARIGKSFVAAFAIHQVLQSLKDVAAELDAMQGGGGARFTAEQRRKQLEGLSASERENIMVGSVEAGAAGGSIKNYLAKSAGLFSFAFSTIAEQFREFGRTKNAAGLLFDWGRSSQRVAARHTDIFNAMRQQSPAKDAEDRSKEKADEEKIFQLRLKRMTVEERISNIRLRMRGKSGVELEELTNQLFEADQEWNKKHKRPGLTVGTEVSRNMEVFDPLRRIGAFNQGSDTGFKLMTFQERIARATERTAENTGEGPL
jgi:hypothetical protein